MARKYGVINEDSFWLRTPRMCDEGGFDTVAEAFAAAAQMVEDGTQELSIVVARYSLKHDCWYEVVGAGVIQMDASQFEVEDEEENEAPSVVVPA
jgi:xylose isomerase